MKIIYKSDTIHQIKIIPRRFVSITRARLTNEFTDKEIELDFFTSFCKNGYLFFSFEFSGKIGNVFLLELYNENDILYRGKITVNE